MSTHIRVHAAYALGIALALLAILLRHPLQDHIGVRCVVGLALAAASIIGVGLLSGPRPDPSGDTSGPSRPQGTGQA